MYHFFSSYISASHERKTNCRFTPTESSHMHTQEIPMSTNDGCRACELAPSCFFPTFHAYDNHRRFVVLQSGAGAVVVANQIKLLLSQCVICTHSFASALSNGNLGSLRLIPLHKVPCLSTHLAPSHHAINSCYHLGHPSPVPQTSGP